jgi:hypothetical protein
MSVLEYQDVFDVSHHIGQALDAARQGVPVSLVQDARRYALVEVDRLLAAFAAASPQARVVHEGDRWCLFVPGLPVLAEGATVNAMLDDALIVLREYADDWVDGVCGPSPSESHWALVQLIALSDDDQLRGWLVGAYS